MNHAGGFAGFAVRPVTERNPLVSRQWILLPIFMPRIWARLARSARAERLVACAQAGWRSAESAWRDLPAQELTAITQMLAIREHVNQARLSSWLRLLMRL